MTGDMADFYEGLYDPYVDGADFDEEGEDGLKDPPALACKYCKCGPLYWDMTPNGWRLFPPNSNVPHSCPQFRRKGESND